MKLLFSVTLLAFTLSGISQAKKDTSFFSGNDIYDNFKNPNENIPLPFQIIDKTTGKILFEKKITGSNCIECYSDLTRIADSFFYSKSYNQAVGIYRIAFKLNGNKGQVRHRYNAARCFSYLDQPDSAFNQLDKIANAGKYNNLGEIKSEKAFLKLYNDPRWNIIIDKVKLNLIAYGEELNSQLNQQPEPRD